MATQTLTDRMASFVLSCANGNRSLDQVTVDATGGAMVAGTLLGQVTANSKYIRQDTAAVDGSEVVAAILYEGIDTAVEVERTVLLRDAEVLEAELTFEDSATGPEITQAKVELAAVGIITR